MRFPCVELEVSCWSEEKLNLVLKIDGDKLFKDLLTNEIFSRQILSWNFKMKFCLNRGLAWADMPTFPKSKEGDFPRLASPWLGLRGRKF